MFGPEGTITKAILNDTLRWAVPGAVISFLLIRSLFRKKEDDVQSYWMVFFTVIAMACMMTGFTSFLGLTKIIWTQLLAFIASAVLSLIIIGMIKFAPGAIMLWCYLRRTKKVWKNPGSKKGWKE